MDTQKLKTVNFEVSEYWTMECPECFHEQDAPMNHDNPMQPMVVECESCGEKFRLTYERD